MPLIEQFQGTAADGTDLTAVYAEQAEANVAFALVFAGDDLPRFVHWGRPIADPATVINLYDALRPQRVSGGLDDTSWPSILPTQAESWLGAPRFEVRRDGVELHCRFAVEAVTAGATDRVDGNAFTQPSADAAESATVIAPVPSAASVTTHVTVGDQLAVARDNDPQPTPTVVVEAVDREQGVGIVWTCELDESGLIRQKLEVANLGGGNLEIGRIELGFPLPADATEILTTTGHHLRERHPQRQPLTIGRFEKFSMTGRPDFDASLLLSAGEPGFGFTRGDVYSVHVGWSGNSVLSAERTPYTQGVIGGGEILLGGEVTLSGEAATYTTPWVYGSYGNGLNEVAARFHAYLRNVHRAARRELGIADKPRPVILNTWEAVYFDQNYDTLTALADKAAAIGVERFVVDDGWFGSRRDDTSGLGDWQIAQDVWPDGPQSLKALADYVHGKGMEFGLWFEPEMVNPDSDMYRTHPDWVLRPTPGRLPMQGRTQQVVDLTNPDAYDYVYGCMDRLVGELGIDYIKWDHNKLVTEAVSPRTGRPAVHAQTLAVYRIFRDLKAAHPGLEIESCSSGGGRVDLGILELADRIWVSDCVDPLERVEIQRYTSLLVPPFMMGEHVGASPAHSTHRPTSQELRMAMAFFGHMGVEWNLLKEPDEDVAKLGEWIAEFKKHREWFAVDTCVHSDAADPAVRVDGMVKPDRSAAFYRFTQVTTSATYPAAPIRLPGLDPDATYRIQPLWLDLDLDALGIANGQSPLGWWTSDGVLLTGQALATYGLRPPSLHPAQSVLFTAVRQ
ncbi:alpha-galactosidase [Bifidobacterium amazonense]|uniref:alpha-galactosidase n=1 Tax=Bifidobacterium amazonense TaxID=2809027 RepID=A0ABS9VTB7_9BIFI|nr:alpha-galactosidase [Bifidobacterium amazonense]MCH9275337.1 alpha-galactosidase [Bifidobacterium amazonense]